MLEQDRLRLRMRRKQADQFGAAVAAEAEDACAYWIFIHRHELLYTKLDGSAASRSNINQRAQPRHNEHYALDVAGSRDGGADSGRHSLLSRLVRGLGDWLDRCARYCHTR